MPQTKFVLKKAIAAGHKVIVVINKIDKPDARVNWVVDKTFDLFVSLGRLRRPDRFPHHLRFGQTGESRTRAGPSLMTDVKPVFETILKSIPAPVLPDVKLQYLAVSLAYDNYIGKIAIGRLYAGSLKKGQDVLHVRRDGTSAKVRLTSVMTYDGLARVETDAAEPGDIIALAGISDISIGESIDRH